MRLHLLLAPLLGLAIALATATPALADHSRHGGYHSRLSGADHLRYIDDPRQRHYRQARRPHLRAHRPNLRHHRPILHDDRTRLRHDRKSFLRDNRGHLRQHRGLRDNRARLNDNRGHLRHHHRPFLRGNRQHLGGFRSNRHLGPRAIAPRRPVLLPDHRVDPRRYRAPSRHGAGFRVRID